MPLQRLQVFPGGRVPDLDGLVIGCGRDPLVVVRECHQLEPGAVPLQRQEAGTPIILHCWLRHNPVRRLLLKYLSRQAVSRTEYKS